MDGLDGEMARGQARTAFGAEAARFDRVVSDAGRLQVAVAAGTAQVQQRETQLRQRAHREPQQGQRSWREVAREQGMAQQPFPVQHRRGMAVIGHIVLLAKTCTKVCSVLFLPRTVLPQVDGHMMSSV